MNFESLLDVKLLSITVFVLIGAWALLWWMLDNLKSLVQIIVAVLAPYFVPQENKTLAERYGNWAVITGATDGIGKEYATEFASRGLNIILISRTESKLVQVANEIESKFRVKTKWIVADFSKGQNIYEELKSELESVSIGILVNNVGRMYDFPDALDNIPEQLLWDMMNINVGAVTMLTRIVVPMMKKCGKGAIVNISSGSELQPVPYMTVYGASKAYVRNFTLAMQNELSPFGITVQLVTPMFVQTKMNEYSTSVMAGGVFVPDVSSYTRSAVFTIGKSSQTTGYWSHGLQYGIMKLVPQWIRTTVAAKMNLQFRSEYYAQQKVKSVNE